MSSQLNHTSSCVALNDPIPPYVSSARVQRSALVAPYEPHDGGSQRLLPIALPYPIEREAPQGSSLLVLRLF